MIWKKHDFEARVAPKWNEQHSASFNMNETFKGERSVTRKICLWIFKHFKAPPSIWDFYQRPSTVGSLGNFCESRVENFQTKKQLSISCVSSNHETSMQQKFFFGANREQRQMMNETD